MTTPFKEDAYRFVGGKRFMCRMCNKPHPIKGSQVVVWGTGRRARICADCAKKQEAK